MPSCRWPLLLTPFRKAGLTCCLADFWQWTSLCAPDFCTCGPGVVLTALVTSGNPFVCSVRSSRAWIQSLSSPGEKLVSYQPSRVPTLLASLPSMLSSDSLFSHAVPSTGRERLRAADWLEWIVTQGREEEGAGGPTGLLGPAKGFPEGGPVESLACARHC